MSSDRTDDAGTFTRATRLLRQTTLTADEANQLIEIIEEMTNTEAARIIERVESKIDATRWFIGAGIAMAGIIAALIAILVAVAFGGNGG